MVLHVNHSSLKRNELSGAVSGVYFSIPKTIWSTWGKAGTAYLGLQSTRERTQKNRSRIGVLLQLKTQISARTWKSDFALNSNHVTTEFKHAALHIWILTGLADRVCVPAGHHRGGYAFGIS